MAYRERSTPHGAAARGIDEVLRDYAQPFVAVGWASGEHASRAALDTAAAIWDLVVDGFTTEQIIALLDENADAHLTKLVAAFVQRKLALFASDRRYVVGPHARSRKQA